MELGIIRVISEIFKSAPRAGLFLVVLVVLSIAAIKIIPLITQAICNLLNTFLASRSKEQTEMMNVIRDELKCHRENSARQFEFNERMAKSTEGALESLRELTSRTASMDHRIFEGMNSAVRSNSDDHRDMADDLKEIKGHIMGKP